MPLYYVPIILVVEATEMSSATEVSDRIIDGVVDILPSGLEGVAVVDNLEKVMPASYGWVDMTHNLVLEDRADKFTIKEKEEK